MRFITRSLNLCSCLPRRGGSRAGRFDLNVLGTQVWLSGPRIKRCIQGTQGLLCAIPPLLQRARNSSSQLCELLTLARDIPLAFSGASAHIRPERNEESKQPLFLSSGGLRDWIGSYTPPGVVWGHGKTGETGAEAAGLADAGST